MHLCESCIETSAQTAPGAISPIRRDTVAPTPHPAPSPPETMYLTLGKVKSETVIAHRTQPKPASRPNSRKRHTHRAIAARPHRRPPITLLTVPCLLCASAHTSVLCRLPLFQSPIDTKTAPRPNDLALLRMHCQSPQSDDENGGYGLVIFDKEKPRSSLDFCMDNSWMTI
ncbi:hypothetical protein Tco_1062911 [Tanacetum coccineum]